LGEFRSDVDSDVAARIFLSGLLVQLTWQELAADVPGLGIDADRLIDSAVELLFAGLRPMVAGVAPSSGTDGSARRL
jgi:hypothetical protein